MACINKLCGVTYQRENVMARRHQRKSNKAVAVSAAGGNSGEITMAAASWRNIMTALAAFHGIEGG